MHFPAQCFTWVTMIVARKLSVSLGLDPKSRLKQPAP
jgi:hypothetical protein